MKRMELKEVKENLWRWRCREEKMGTKNEKRRSTKIDDMERNVDKIEKIIVRLKEEEGARKTMMEEEKKYVMIRRKEIMKG